MRAICYPIASPGSSAFNGMMPAGLETPYDSTSLLPDQLSPTRQASRVAESDIVRMMWIKSWTVSLPDTDSGPVEYQANAYIYDDFLFANPAATDPRDAIGVGFQYFVSESSSTFAIPRDPVRNSAGFLTIPFYLIFLKDSINYGTYLADATEFADVVTPAGTITINCGPITYTETLYRDDYVGSYPDLSVTFTATEWNWGAFP